MAIEIGKYTCPSCGAPLEIKNRFSKVVVCEYCGTHVEIGEQGLVSKGKFPKLTDYPTFFWVGAKGKIKGKEFKVLGRMRYNYGSGFWDEWFIDYGGDELAWLQEDEGNLTLFHDRDIVSEIPSYEQIRPGMSIKIGNISVFVKEKGKAKIEGGEGELYHYYEPGTEIYYIDGFGGGKKVSIEFGIDEIEYFVGDVIKRSDVEFYEEKGDE